MLGQIRGIYPYMGLVGQISGIYPYMGLRLVGYFRSCAMLCMHDIHAPSHPHPP